MEHSSSISPQQNNVESLDLNKLSMILRTKWIWIVLIFLLANATAYLFIRYTKNIYQSESELKLEIKSEASGLNIPGMMEDQNLNLVSGEIEIIRSKLFLNRVLDFSDFEISFFSVGRVLNDELFFRAPAIIRDFNKNHSLYNVPIYFEELNTREFTLQFYDNKEIAGRYGQKVVVGDLQLIIDRNPDFAKGDEIGYFFVINSRDALLGYLAANLIVEPLNFQANTLRVAFKDNNPFKAQAVLNKVDSLYLEYSNEQKNQANRQKIDWLVSELGQLEKKMEAHEDYFKSFTLQNKSIDLETDFKTTVTAIYAIDSQRYEMSKRIGSLNSVIQNLEKNNILLSYSMRQNLPAQANTKIDELQKLKLEMDKLMLSYNETSLAYTQRQKQLEALKVSIQEQLNTLRNDWLKGLEELNQRKASLETRFATLPDKSTEFTKNQRFYKLYEEFYFTLMQSKSEFEIAQAGSIPDFKILSSASLPLKPISPNKLMVTGVGFVAGIMLALLFVGILYLVNNKITSLIELERIEKAPILGAVPLSKSSNGSLHILDHPRSVVSEAIRSLRTNLDFFNIKSAQKVITISSTVSGEGKSFIAMNLGAVIALSKKRVVLIDLDMRKAKSELAVNDAGNFKGVSTVLINRNSWQECVLKTQLDTFDFIPSGPQPPNPSELLLNGEFSDLLEDLKKHYDFIIIDTPPVGLVTDGIMAMKRSDISVYVFRANYSKKEFLFNLKRVIGINKFGNIATILNAVPASAKTYGYGYYEEKGKGKK